MRHARQRQWLVRGLAIATAAATAIVLVPGAASGTVGPDRIVMKVSDLNGPRGIDVNPPRRIVYSESDGTVSAYVLPRSAHSGTTVLGNVPTQSAPAVAQLDASHAFILTGAGGGGLADTLQRMARQGAAEAATPGSTLNEDSPDADGAKTLYLWSKGSGIKAVADIGAYQKTDPDPYNIEGKPTESNPFGLAALPDGSALVSDAANNDLLRVFPDGTIYTVARIKPRVVPVPDALADQPGMPPPGTMIPAEGVATSVTVGADGAYYVGELRGFPATPGTSEIWRIDPRAVAAICDPLIPDAGPCTRYSDGLTSVMDLAGAPDGAIYAVSLVKQSWLQFELGIGAPIGGAYRVAAGEKPDLISSDRLVLPGGISVSPKTGGIDKVFVAGPVFGQGGIARVR